MTQLDPQARQRMNTAASAAFIAMSFVARPEIWPMFAAWAEQQLPDETWTEADRQWLANDAAIMARLAEATDE